MKRGFFCVCVWISILGSFLLFPSPVFAYYTNMSASVVVGQSDFTSSSAGTTASTLRDPRGVTVCSGNKLAVADPSNNRILIWNSIPIRNAQAADVVVGQPDFTSSTANNGGRSASSINAASGVLCVGNKLVISDTGNNRVLIFNSIPTSNGASADVVVGQLNFSSGSANMGGSVGPNTLSAPPSSTSDGTKLIIMDRSNIRVLIYNSFPTTNGTSADVVVGQSDFTSTARSCSASGFASSTSPVGVFTDGTKLFVADSAVNGGATGHRVLIYNSIPTTNGVSADVVVGQSDFITCTANTGGIGANTLNEPHLISVDNRKRLYITDRGNVRVLIWNTIPTTNNAPADIVIGQPNFTSSSANQGGSPAANTLNGVRQFTVSGAQLFISDGDNNRLLIFSNTLPDTKLTNVLVSGIENGKQRFKGTASTNVVNGVVRYVEYSINGSTWTGATPTDGQFNDPTEDYSFDFDPKTNNPDTGKNVGFVIRVRNTHNNTVDSGASALYFEPFVANSPGDKTHTSSSLPSFSFSINSWRFEDLVKDLDSFRISINKDNTGWVPYIQDIPVSYEKVRESGDNKRRSVVASSGNGVYEDKRKVVTYTSNNGTIDVQAKAVNRATGDSSDKDFLNGGFLLPQGSYQWRVEALDRAGHTQATGERTLFVGGSRQIITSRSWFPLTIDSFSGVGTNLDWSSIHPQDIPSSFTSSSQPTITGIATSGSTVTITLTNKICVARRNTNCTASSSTTTGDNSRYTLTLPSLLSGNDYRFILSVADTGGNYNQLPEIQLQAGE